ncbi:MAG: NAD(P)/FAD-dependent oxidoreductase [Chitinophagaceae bacterium]|nr:MAG: FAD dependent oxidoreductase [Bacteroidetes bacterium OLB11]MCC6448623.1 NAD(P)/FAD-dependent oxidoreductase [Chitinophagaceae bacterium]HMN33061.1 NAD(P)/FAD-dependent oxidoreductase [Chitinophagaceae bacterium]
MIKEVQIQIPAFDFNNEKKLNQYLHSFLGINKHQSFEFEILKKSLDARSKTIFYNLKIRAYIDEPLPIESDYQFRPQLVSNNEEVHIIGAGPAGLFCALQCIMNGLKPVIFERGKDVRERRRDLAILNKEGILNTESNYCFGEGGAGTYSDGKLYTRSNKRGKLQTVLEWFVQFGAESNIRYDAHPHIGTNKLPHIITAMREQILACGGEVHFSQRLTDIEIKSNQIQRITLNHHTKENVKNVVLATGHSAGDIYQLLYKKNIFIESKPFALGVRVEHPQEIIDQAQYKCVTRPEYLPPASYSLVEQVNDRGVFSFCMCPGGIIAPASTQENQLVVNGWSPSKRNNPYANSGMVVSIKENDFSNETPLGAFNFQKEIEEKSFIAGGGKYVAPAMRLNDFVNHQFSNTLPKCSYLPGVKSVPLYEVLPDFVYQGLQKAFYSFGKKIKGFNSNDAIVVATESRTSSPIRITRHAESLQHVQIQNLYPCAEGAGYAGGIVSAAMDGINIAEKLLENRNQ